MPLISFLNVINQIQALIILHPLLIMVIHTNKRPDLAAPSLVSWEGGDGYHQFKEESKIPHMLPKYKALSVI